MSIELVTVLEAHDPFALNVAKSLLEDAMIPYIVNGDRVGLTLTLRTPQGTRPIGSGIFCGRIQVGREFEAEARALLEPLQSESATQSDLE